jgi:hypothetical protein
MGAQRVVALARIEARFCNQSLQFGVFRDKEELEQGSRTAYSGGIQSGGAS